MKHFNIVKNHHYIINNTHLPINSVYGKFTITYKIKTGEREVYSKGNKYIKPVLEKREDNIIYYCDNFKPTANGNFLVYNIHVWDDKSKRWVDKKTTHKFKCLGLFLADMFEKNDIRHTTKCKPWIDGLRESAPHEVRAQVHSDSVYRASIGYALSANVMTCHNVNRDGWAYDNTFTSKYLVRV